MHDFRKLGVWNKSRDLVKLVFESTNTFPKEEMFGLISQMKRSAISIPSNIAEGCGRGTNKQLSYHLDVALGSAFELETQILVDCDLEYLSIINKEILIDRIQEIEKMIIGLNKSLK